MLCAKNSVLLLRFAYATRSKSALILAQSIMFHKELGPWLVLGRAGMNRDGHTLRERLGTFMLTSSMRFRHESCQPRIESTTDQTHYETLCNGFAAQ